MECFSRYSAKSSNDFFNLRCICVWFASRVYLKNLRWRNQWFRSSTPSLTPTYSATESHSSAPIFQTLISTNSEGTHQPIQVSHPKSTQPPQGRSINKNQFCRGIPNHRNRKTISRGGKSPCEGKGLVTATIKLRKLRSPNTITDWALSYVVTSKGKYGGEWGKDEDLLLKTLQTILRIQSKIRIGLGWPEGEV